MRILTPCVLGFFLSLLASNLYAREVAGIEFPESASVSGTNLVLNGAGLRTKFFIKVYAGALYLKSKASDAEKVLADTNPKRIVMHFIYDEVSKKKLTDGWNDGFENNQDEKQFKLLKSRLDTFNSYFTDLHKGDRVVLDYLPGKGTQITIKNENKGLIEGGDFHRALLKVWLGDEPADWGLRDAMLGDD